jgi:glycosyltransferase involved in cell wall biosynthesis
MRVALNLEQLLHRPPGGIGRYTAELARLLPVPEGAAIAGERSRERVDVATFVARHRREAIEAALLAFGLSGTKPVRLPVWRPALYEAWNTFGFPPLGALSRSLRGLDLIHAPSLAVPPRGGVPLIVTVHDAAPLVFPDTYPRHGRWFHARGFAAAARRADVVIAPSVAAADEITERTSIRRDRIRIVPHGVTQRPVGDGIVKATRAILGVGDDPYVLWVGTLEPRKNLSLLVEAFRRFVSMASMPHRLVIVGPRGWLDAADQLAEPAAVLGERVHFTGPVRDDRLVALYRGADLLAFPSLHEGFGLPVLEAMAQETPVVCSDIPVLREVAGDAARFLPPNDPDAWATALLQVLGDEVARRALAAAGRERAAGFTWERCIERTRALYREVLS